MSKKLTVKPVDHERVKIAVDETETSLHLQFSGDIDMENPAEILDELFDHCHKDAQALALEEVVLDFQELNFMNSSGIKAIAKWIMKQAPLNQEERYHIRIIHNRKVTWQMTSLPTLTFLLPGIVKVE